jgi:hypothetical protein
MLTSVVVPKPVTGGDSSCLTSGSQSVVVPSDVPLFEETSILILMVCKQMFLLASYQSQ